MMKALKKRRKGGFTLIELIVVIAILGILAAIAVPRLTSSTQNAQRSTVEANLRTIDGAVAIWQASNTGTVDQAALTNATTGTLKAWPVGPGSAVYTVVNGVAHVSGTVGGKTFAAATPYSTTMWD